MIKSRRKKYILFGAGVWGKHALKVFGKDRVVCFCDNFKHGEMIDDVPVVLIESISEYIQDSIDIVIATKNIKSIIEIADQLKENNYPYRLLDDTVKDIVEEEARIYDEMNIRDSFCYDANTFYPIPWDRIWDAGTVKQYFWQDLWAAKKIFKNRPKEHYDIGSRVDGFIAHLLSFGQKINLIDIRSLEADIPNVDFTQSDATELKSIGDNSIESISALCSLEHFGLGRYSDPIDPEACFKCFEAIQKKVREHGKIYISVPIGREHVEFNAHRIFNAKTIKDAFDRCELVELSATNENKIEYNIDLHKYDKEPERGAEIFGLFEFVKK